MRRLVAAGGRADLHDDVLVVGRVGRDEHELDVLLERGQLRLDGGDLLLGELLQVGVGKHLLGLCQIVRRLHVFLRLVRKRPLAGVLLGQAVVFLLIGEHGRVAHPGLQVLVGLDDLDQLLPHVRFLHVRDCPSSCEPVICATGYDTRRPHAVQRPLQDQRMRAKRAGNANGARSRRGGAAWAQALARRAKCKQGAKSEAPRDRPHAGAAPAGRGPKAGADAPRTAATSWQVLTKRSTKGRAGSDRYRRYAE